MSRPAAPPWVTPVTLSGRRVRLEPLGPQHLPGLVAAGADPATWAWMHAPLTDEASMRAWLDDALRAREAGTALPFATLDAASGALIGSTRYMAIEPSHRRLEIGWTWLAPDARGSGANSEAKLLMLEHAFERLGAMRVEFKTDARNARSRGALEAIGARFEGVFRRHMLMHDGRVRDSAWYAVTDEDWPAVRDHLAARIRAQLERGIPPVDGIAPAEDAAGAEGRRMSGPALEVETVDYHTGGEPFRIVLGGVPTPQGATILERCRFALEHLDDVRRLLVHEPRGHADMYGCHVVPPNDDGADLGVVFFHNEGYSTACGHGTIALVTWALESGRLPMTGPETAVTVDVPSGRLACVARCDAAARRVTSVRFRNVPAFVLATDVTLPTSRGPVTLDVAYGGAFYGSADVRPLGLAVDTASLPALIELQRELRPALDAALEVVHPDEPELRGIYGIIWWQDEATAPGDDAALTQRNVTVFADGEVDRSPCGSGTSARLALLHAAGRLGVGETLRHRSIVDSAFAGRVVEATRTAGRAAVITEVEGSAHLAGRSRFTLDPRDPLGTGFLLR